MGGVTDRTILHVTAPAAYGGLERVVSALAAGQAAAGADVHVAIVTNRSAATGVRTELAFGAARVHVLDIPARAYLRERRELVELTGRIRPDVVHTHGYRSDIMGGIGARARKVRVVSTVHGFTGGGLRNRLYESVQRRYLRRFDAVVAVSRPMAGRLLASGIRRSRLHLLPNAWIGAGPLLSRIEARAALGLSEDAVYVGWVGRLSREKGCDLAVEALSKLPDPRIRLCVVGDGAERAALERLAARAGVAGRIVWAGALPSAAHLFSAFDAFVLSSRTEGTPIALFEAMAAHVPVICTTVGGVPDVVSDAEALLVPPESPDALAWALNDILEAEPGAAGERAMRAAARLQRDFPVGPWLQGYGEVYRSATERAPTLP